ncbi:MAG: DUF642 domain-containing protein [Candidatus Sericytochromatia bacterium]|nr:DUF642 domain-containing protein [Candidatus Sericytochromatia bacterium]
MPTPRFFLSAGLGLTLAASLSLNACTQVPQLSTSAVTQNAAANQLTVNNNAANLSARLTRKNEVVRLQREGFNTQQEERPLELRLVAEVAPPLINETSVQATNVHIEGDLAYVSYDIAGDEFSGGAYILDISNPAEPQLLSEITLGDTDFYSLTRSGDRLYLSGASLREDLNSRAVLQVVGLSNNGRQFASDDGLVDIPSFAATDVARDQNNIYVTTGARDGGVVSIDGQTLTQKAFYPLEDARSVTLDYREGDAQRVSVFRGTQGELHILDSDLQLLRKKAFPGTASIPFSKSTIEVKENLALIGAGDGGALSVNLEDLSQRGQLGTASGITNGASVSGDYAFMAEGSDGVSVARMSASGELIRLGTLAFENAASANMVAYRDNVLFVANGRGGLSILTVNHQDPPVSEPSPIPGGIQAVYLRWLQPTDNKGSSRAKGQLTIEGPGRIVGVVYNPKNGAGDLSATDFFAARIAPELPGLLQNTVGSQQRTLEKGDIFDIVNDKTLTFDFELGHPGGSDDIRVLIDHGNTVGDNQLQISLDQAASSEAGIIVGSDHQEVFSRSVVLSTAAAGPMGEDSYTVRPQGHDLIIHREDMVPRSQLPAGLLGQDDGEGQEQVEVPTAPSASPGNACQGTPDNLVVNGGFELPEVGSSWRFVDQLPCWTIVKPAGKAELDPVNTWAPAEGKQSLDLNPDSPGEMYQDIATEPGQAYTLSFQLAGNINGAKGEKQLAVYWGDENLGTFSFNTQGKSQTAMGWQQMNVNLRPEQTPGQRMRLRFVSLTAGSNGPAIDDVRVQKSQTAR